MNFKIIQQQINIITLIKLKTMIWQIIRLYRNNFYLSTKNEAKSLIAFLAILFSGISYQVSLYQRPLLPTNHYRFHRKV